MKPATLPRERRNRADLAETERELDANLRAIRAALAPADGSPEDAALSGVETFCALAMRVLKKTNPSKIRSEAVTLEIKCRADGIPVVRGCE